MTVISEEETNSVLGAPAVGADFKRALEQNHLPTWPVTKEEENEFWSARKELEIIHNVAAHQLIGSWALLGVVLARIIAATPRTLRLPPIIGTPVSLNFFVALDGSSGGGKDLAIRTGKEIIPHNDKWFQEGSLGSGEGLVERYGYFETKNGKTKFVQQHNSLLFIESEVDMQTALNNRQSATLMPMLRKAYTGDLLDFGYKAQNRSYLQPHAYRLCLILGIQPERAQAFFDDADGGTPQRFNFFPTLDPNGLEEVEYPDLPLDWKPPEGIFKGLNVQTEISVCQEAAQEIRAARKSKLHGTGYSGLDSHALLSKEKLAAGLSLLDGRTDITKEDWDLAGFVNRVSSYSRDSIVAKLKIQEQNKNVARGKAQAVRESVVDEHKEEAQLHRVYKSIRNNLGQVPDEEWITHNKLRTKVKADIRPLFDEAVEKLIDTGEVEFQEKEYKKQMYKEYRFKR